MKRTEDPGDCSDCDGRGCNDCSQTGCDCGEVLNKTVYCDRCKHIFDEGFNELGYWTQEKYYALVMHYKFSSHSEVYAIFSNAETAEDKRAELEAECKEKNMGIHDVIWSVDEVDMKRNLGYLGQGQKFNKITVVNCVPSVAKFQFYPEHVDVNTFVIDECKPLEWEMDK